MPRSIAAADSIRVSDSPISRVGVSDWPGLANGPKVSHRAPNFPLTSSHSIVHRFEGPKTLADTRAIQTPKRLAHGARKS